MTQHEFQLTYFSFNATTGYLRKNLTQKYSLKEKGCMICIVNIFISEVIQFPDTVIRYDSVCDDCYLIDCRTDKTKEWMN